ncbi:MAG: hypothetical protein KKF22_00095 [Gammaproteobacteria bacterium]|nr:hypothetical protein [Gammaproteobacteria bacterium]
MANLREEALKVDRFFWSDQKKSRCCSTPIGIGEHCWIRYLGNNSTDFNHERDMSNQEEDLAKFRASIDKDIGFQSIRTKLVVICLIFIALNLSGATLEEVNTFIFKININNHIGLSYFFLGVISFLFIRYYAYAYQYRVQLDKLWINRFINDYKIYNASFTQKHMSGLLSKALNFDIEDEPGLEFPEYERDGFYKRSLTYLRYSRDENGNDDSYIARISLTDFTNTKSWKLQNYLQMRKYELMYSIEAKFRYREYLDIFTPYLISAGALISFIFCDEIIEFMNTF